MPPSAEVSAADVEVLLGGVACVRHVREARVSACRGNAGEIEGAGRSHWRCSTLEPITEDGCALAVSTSGAVHTVYTPHDTRTNSFWYTSKYTPKTCDMRFSRHCECVLHAHDIQSVCQIEAAGPRHGKYVDLGRHSCDPDRTTLWAHRRVLGRLERGQSLQRQNYVQRRVADLSGWDVSSCCHHNVMCAAMFQPTGRLGISRYSLPAAVQVARSTAGPITSASWTPAFT